MHWTRVAGCAGAAAIVLFGWTTPPALAGPTDDEFGARTGNHGNSAYGAIFVSQANETLARVPLTPKASKGQNWICRFYIGVGPSSNPYFTDQYGIIRHVNDAVTPQEGGGYMLVCRDQTGAVVYERETVYNPGDPASMLQGEDGALARAISAALADLNAPPPQVRTSPPLDQRQIVGVKTWFWLESWDSILAPASAAGYTITLTATPDELIIDPGDGSGPMPACTQANSPAWKPKDEGGPRDTGCGHTYHQRSGDKPGGVFKASATLNYRVTWRATDPAGTEFDSGDLGTITGTQPLDITVHQIQAVGRS